MRTTITFSKDVAAAIERLRRLRSIGVSEAVNELIRRGLAAPDRNPGSFEQETHDFGRVYIDYTNTWEAIEAAESELSRSPED